MYYIKTMSIANKQNIAENVKKDDKLNLKSEIVLYAELGDDFIQNVNKYVPLDDILPLLNISCYKVIKRANHDIYDVIFYNDNKMIESRKAIIKNDVLHVARKASPRKMSLFNVYLNLRLFGR